MNHFPPGIISDSVFCTIKARQGRTSEHVHTTQLKLQRYYDRTHRDFFIREETAVKSHRLTNVGSAQIMNLESEHPFCLQQVRCSCWNWDAVAGLQFSAGHHEFQSGMSSSR